MKLTKYDVEVDAGDLGKCPWCGGKVIAVRRNMAMHGGSGCRFFVGCCNSDAFINTYYCPQNYCVECVSGDTLQEAVDRWNARLERIC